MAMYGRAFGRAPLDSTDGDEARVLDQLTRVRMRQRLAMFGLWLWLCLVLLWLLPAGNWSASAQSPVVAIAATIALTAAGALPVALYVAAGRSHPFRLGGRISARRFPSRPEDPSTLNAAARAN